MSPSKTLRELTGMGHTPTTVGKSALILIDCQNTYRRGVMQLEGVESVRKLEGFRFQVTSSPGMDARPSVSRMAAQHNIGLIELKLLKNSLESIFSQLTTEQPKAE